MNELLILAETEFLEVEVIQQELLEVAQQGPQGPQGPAGPPGGDLNHVHEQAVAAATWTVNHGLGKFPSVTVVDSAGEECEGEVQHTSASQCVLTFSAAFSGRAFLN